jgi:hypothetical protein
MPRAPCAFDGCPRQTNLPARGYCAAHWDSRRNRPRQPLERDTCATCGRNCQKGATHCAQHNANAREAQKRYRARPEVKARDRDAACLRRWRQEFPHEESPPTTAEEVRERRRQRVQAYQLVLWRGWGEA